MENINNHDGYKKGWYNKINFTNDLDEIIKYLSENHKRNIFLKVTTCYDSCKVQYNGESKKNKISKMIRSVGSEKFPPGSIGYSEGTRFTNISDIDGQPDDDEYRENGDIEGDDFDEYKEVHELYDIQSISLFRVCSEDFGKFLLDKLNEYKKKNDGKKNKYGTPISSTFEDFSDTFTVSHDDTVWMFMEHILGKEKYNENVEEVEGGLVDYNTDLYYYDEVIDNDGNKISWYIYYQIEYEIFELGFTP
tara:strand:- start:191 stop:937 length:747 start_codon:yes stop_codon:yes gene_type:complete